MMNINARIALYRNASFYRLNIIIIINITIINISIRIRLK